MRPVALTSFKKRCIVPATVQMFLQNSVLEVEGPLGKAELHLKTYDKKGGFSVKLVQHPQAHQELHFRTRARGSKNVTHSNVYSYAVYRRAYQRGFSFCRTGWCWF